MTANALQTFAKAHGAFLGRVWKRGLTTMQGRVLCELPATHDELEARDYERTTITEAVKKLRRLGMVKPHQPGWRTPIERTADGDALILGPLKTLNSAKA